MRMIIICFLFLFPLFSNASDIQDFDGTFALNDIALSDSDCPKKIDITVFHSMVQIFVPLIKTAEATSGKFYEFRFGNDGNTSVDYSVNHLQGNAIIKDTFKETRSNGRILDWREVLIKNGESIVWQVNFFNKKGKRTSSRTCFYY